MELQKIVIMRQVLQVEFLDQLMRNITRINVSLFLLKEFVDSADGGGWHGFLVSYEFQTLNKVADMIFVCK